MFTLSQITEAFKKVKSGKDFPQFVQDLKLIGVTHYDNYVADGGTIYFGENNFEIAADAKYPAMEINKQGSADRLKTALSIHQAGQADYFTFCKQAAEAGVKKWRTHMLQMTVTYIDPQENNLLVEGIPFL